MMRFAKGLTICLAVSALGLAGCDAGGVEQGLPTGANATVSPDMQKSMNISMSPPKAGEIAQKKKEADKATKALETPPAK